MEDPVSIQDYIDIQEMKIEPNLEETQKEPENIKDYVESEEAQNEPENIKDYIESEELKVEPMLEEKQKDEEIEELEIITELPSKVKTGSENMSCRCSICGASFMEKNKLNRHIAVIHMLKCDYCDNAFTVRAQLVMHVMQVHKGS